VIEPRRVRSPLEYSAGTSPVKPMNPRADGNRRQSTTSAASVSPGGEMTDPADRESLSTPTSADCADHRNHAAALAAAQELLARTAELPTGRRELLTVVGEYRRALHALAGRGGAPLPTASGPLITRARDPGMIGAASAATMSLTCAGALRGPQ
jgi:hypothetical protein